MPCPRPDPDDVVLDAALRGVLDPLDVHQQRGSCQAHRHHRDEALASREDLGKLIAREQRERLIDRVRPDVARGSRHRWSLAVTRALWPGGATPPPANPNSGTCYRDVEVGGVVASDLGAPVIGSRLPMLDARARVSGSLRYVQDLSLPGMLHARILRSPYAHARLVSIDARRADRLPGVIATLTRNDLEDPGLDPWFGPFLKDQAVVAIDKVRYVGDPVAAIAAVDEATAEEALELIDVEYAELPAVFDLDEAMADGAPILHEGDRRIGNRRRDILHRQPGLANSNIVHFFRQRKGDVDGAFAAADVIVEGTYDSPQVQHVPLETHAIVAEFDADHASVWASSQAPRASPGCSPASCADPMPTCVSGCPRWVAAMAPRSIRRSSRSACCWHARPAARCASRCRATRSS